MNTHTRIKDPNSYFPEVYLGHWLPPESEAGTRQPLGDFHDHLAANARDQYMELAHLHVTNFGEISKGSGTCRFGSMDYRRGFAWFLLCVLN